MNYAVPKMIELKNKFIKRNKNYLCLIKFMVLL